MRIVQMSDVHVGSGLFRQDLLEATIEESNALQPDLVAIVGDLTMEGYRWEFEEAREYFECLECPNVIYAMGNHDVNNLRDAGDVMAILRELKIDMVLSGHRHVPYVWSISGVRIVHSGTVSTMRVRGTMPPSYNVVEIDEQSVNITLHQPGKGEEGKEPLASFSRTPVTTSEFYPAFERFVLYDRLPFLSASPNTPPWEGEPADPDAGGGPKR